MEAATLIEPRLAPRRALPTALCTEHLEDRQLTERAHFEASYRRGDLRGLPTCFGELESA